MLMLTISMLWRRRSTLLYEMGFNLLNCSVSVLR